MQGAGELQREWFLWPGKVPGEIYDLNISLFLGQEMIAHRWNLQREPECSGPTQAAQQKAPFTGSIQV